MKVATTFIKNGRYARS